MARRRPAGPSRGSGGSEGHPPERPDTPTPTPVESPPSTTADRSRPQRDDEVRVEPYRVPTELRDPTASSGGRRPAEPAPEAPPEKASRRLVLPMPGSAAPPRTSPPPVFPSEAIVRPRPTEPSQPDDPDPSELGPPVIIEDGHPWVRRGVSGVAVVVLAFVVYAFLSQGDAPVEVVLTPDRTETRIDDPVRPSGAGRVIGPRVRPATEASSSPVTKDRPMFGRARNVDPRPVWTPERVAAQGQVENAGIPFSPEFDNEGESPDYQRSYGDESDEEEVVDAPYVLVFSRPPGMNVYLNGVPAGMTPLLRQLTAPTASMRVRVDGLGFQTVERTVAANPRGHIRLGVDMKPVPGK